MPIIPRENIERYLNTGIFPAMNVPEESRQAVIDDVCRWNQEGSDPVGSGLIGVMWGMTQYLRFASELGGARFSSSTIDSDIYDYGIKRIEQGVQAFYLLEKDPALANALLVHVT
ncbi:MAG: hypothetical protein V1743_00490 [Nanoarchaeota archaeon]